MPSLGVKPMFKPTETKSELYLIMESWAKQNNIEITVDPTRNRAEKLHFWKVELANGFSNKHISDPILVSSHNQAIMLHECAHRYLMKEGIFVSHYYELPLLEKSLKLVEDDYKSGRLTAEYYEIFKKDLMQMIEEWKNKPEMRGVHHDLNATLFGISKWENLISSSVKPIGKGGSKETMGPFFKKLVGKMERCLGSPQDYRYKYSNDMDYWQEPWGANAGPSWVGNLIDESHIFRFPVDSMGHPMENYFEFFASFCSTLCLDGKHMFSMLEKFEKLASKEEAVAPIYNNLCTLLCASLDMARGFKNELSSQPGAANSKEIANFGANIERLDAWLSRQGK